MSPQAMLGQIIGWLRQAVLVVILASLALLLLKSLGVVVSIRTLDHVALAYAAGAYWLTR